MNKKTLKALKASIKHWEENVAAKTPTDASTGSENCALCAAFMDGETACQKCPVAMHVNINACIDTPYIPASDRHDNWAMASTKKARTNAKRRWRRAAQKEVDFLKSLLPEGEQP